MCSCLKIDPQRQIDRWSQFFQLTLPGVHAIRFRYELNAANEMAVFFNVTLDRYDLQHTKRVPEALRGRIDFKMPTYFNYRTRADVAKAPDKLDWVRNACTI